MGLIKAGEREGEREGEKERDRKRKRERERGRESEREGERVVNICTHCHDHICRKCRRCGPRRSPASGGERSR